MNAPSRSAFPNLSLMGEATAREPGDARMDQIRELLFGEQQQKTDARFAEMSARLAEIEGGLTRRLEAIEARLSELSTQVSGQQRAAFDELSRGVADLGVRIRRIAGE